MEFGFDAEDEAFRRTARDWLTAHPVGDPVVRQDWERNWAGAAGSASAGRRTATATGGRA